MKNRLLNERRLNTYILPFLRYILMFASVAIPAYMITGMLGEHQKFYINLNSKIFFIICAIVFLVCWLSKSFLEKWKKRTDFLIDNFEDTVKFSKHKKKYGELDEDGDLNIGLMLKRGSENALEDLNKLIGLQKVKDEMIRMESLYQYESENNKGKESVARHLAFLGNPGTGKTEVASIFSGILYKYGRIKYNMYLQCTGNDLTGEYLGQTKAKVDAIFKRCHGGVLFIDEAYILGQGGNDNLAAEAVAQLLVHMESEKDTVIIFAGYSNEMQKFISINPGLASRIGTTIYFPDYSADELIQITEKFMQKKNVTLSDDAKAVLKSIYQEKINRHESNFSNGRYARNCFDKIYSQHALLYQHKRDVFNMQANIINVTDILSIKETLLNQS